QLDGLCHQAAAEGRAVGAGGKADARAGGGGGGDGGQQLRVVGEAVAAPGVGPGPVEYVFTPGVILEVERHEGLLRAALDDGEVAGGPAAGGADAAAVFEEVEKFPAQEGVVHRDALRLPGGGGLEQGPEVVHRA